MILRLCSYSIDFKYQRDHILKKEGNRPGRVEVDLSINSHTLRPLLHLRRELTLRRTK